MVIVPFLLYVLVTTFTPGPNNIISMTLANQFGYRRTLRFILGIGAGFFALMLACGYFNLTLFRFMPKIKLAMSILGSLYMLYLALKIMMAEPLNGKRSPDTYHSFFSGFVLQFMNPKGILFGITVFSTFIIPFYKSNLSMVLFSFALAAAGFAAPCCWAVFGALFRTFLSKYERPFNVAMGVMLIYSAITIY